eukprot:CFRG2547T1
MRPIRMLCILAWFLFAAPIHAQTTQQAIDFTNIEETQSALFFTTEYVDCEGLEFSTNIHILNETSIDAPNDVFQSNAVELGVFENSFYYQNGSNISYTEDTMVFFNVVFENSSYELWLLGVSYIDEMLFCVSNESEFQIWTNVDDREMWEISPQNPAGRIYMECPHTRERHVGSYVTDLVDDNGGVLRLQCRISPCSIRNICEHGVCQTDHDSGEAFCQCDQKWYGMACNETIDFHGETLSEVLIQYKNCNDRKEYTTSSLAIFRENSPVSSITTGVFENSFEYANDLYVKFLSGDSYYLHVYPAYNGELNLKVRFPEAPGQIREAQGCQGERNMYAYVLLNGGGNMEGMFETVSEVPFPTCDSAKGFSPVTHIGGLVDDLKGPNGNMVIECYVDYCENEGACEEGTLCLLDNQTSGYECIEETSSSVLSIIIITVVAIFVGIVLVGLLCLYRIRRRRKKKEGARTKDNLHSQRNLPPAFIEGIDHPSSVYVREKVRMSHLPISSKSVVKLDIIGSGNFGVVYSGKLRDEESSKESPVAIKELKVTESNVSGRAGGRAMSMCTTRAGVQPRTAVSTKPRLGASDGGFVTRIGSSVVSDDFLLEAQLMQKMDHPNVMGCIGIVEGPPVSIILDVMTMGDLRSYLSTERDHENSVTVGERYFFAFQIARGMRYLHQQNVVHRDLAARNCMLSCSTDSSFGFPVLKVTDFGLSRTIETDKEYYRMGYDGQVPARWTSIEGLLERKFSKASDVWSFGVTMWEVFDYAKDMPYKEMNLFKLVEYLKDDNRLEQPIDCPKEAYEVMHQCWNSDPQKRQTFSELVFHLGHLFLPHCPKIASLRTDATGDTCIVSGRLNHQANDKKISFMSMPAKEGFIPPVGCRVLSSGLDTSSEVDIADTPAQLNTQCCISRELTLSENSVPHSLMSYVLLNDTPNFVAIPLQALAEENEGCKGTYTVPRSPVNIGSFEQLKKPLPERIPV